MQSTTDSKKKTLCFFQTMPSQCIQNSFYKLNATRLVIAKKLIVIIRIVHADTFSVLLFNQNTLDCFFSFAHSSIKVDDIKSAFQHVNCMLLLGLLAHNNVSEMTLSKKHTAVRQ